MNEQQIKTLIQQEIQAYMNNKQYNISKVPNHEHNGTDTIRLSASSIKESIVYDATKDSTSPSFDGFARQALTAGQNINSVFGLRDDASFYTFPIGVIYGSNLPGMDTFQYGEAAQGTMVFFDNINTLNPSTSQLWIRTERGWYGIAATDVVSVI